MPPRKKAKASAASTPLGDGQPGTPQASNTAAQSQDEVLNDPWEDEQEIQLLKSMMKWKPTGERPLCALQASQLTSQACTSTSA
jgi:MRG-binding protein